ncbi:MAG: trehalose-6-phosphate synthase [Thermomicrobiales bacterium]
MIRAKRPDAIIQQFVHIPWPEPDYWRLLPLSFRQAICEGMLGNDIIGFRHPTTPAASSTSTRHCSARCGRSTIRAELSSGEPGESRVRTYLRQSTIRSRPEVRLQHGSSLPRSLPA